MLRKVEKCKSHLYPVNTKHLYNINSMLDQRRRPTRGVSLTCRSVCCFRHSGLQQFLVYLVWYRWYRPWVVCVLYPIRSLAEGETNGLFIQSSRSWVWGSPRIRHRPIVIYSLHYPLSNIIEQNNIKHHLYADDTQIYLSLSLKNPAISLKIRTK